MEQYLEFELENGQKIIVETEKAFGTGIEKASHHENVVKQVSKKFSDALTPLRATSESIFKVFNGLAHAPDEIQVELSVKMSAEAGIIISSGSIEGNFKIVLKWKNSKTGDNE